MISNSLWKTLWASVFCLILSQSSLLSQPTSHPHLFFDKTGLQALRARVLSSPRLNTIWTKFQEQRVDSSFRVKVSSRGIAEIDEGRNYGDALADLTLAYVVTQDPKYRDKAIAVMLDLTRQSTWGKSLVKAHISMGVAFCWDVLYDQLSSSQREKIRKAVLSKADNRVNSDVYANVNWTTSVGEGLIGLAFDGDGDAGFNSFVRSLLAGAKRNFKEKDRSVLWAHGTDGFPHQGLGYWRKYNHIGLFLSALRFNQPANDWFHLGAEFPASEFFSQMAYPRIYADVQHQDLATLTWADSRQVRKKPQGQFGNLGVLTLVASEYKDGYVLDFIDYLLTEVETRFNQEDWATFIFYDDAGIPQRNYRDLPLSKYWPDMEAAIFRSGWSKDDLVFYMRCGSPGGHSRRLKSLQPGGHDHPDANGFVLFYDNDYLAAEDGVFPLIGPDKSNNKITYGHNTFLIDGGGQRGDKTRNVKTTSATMDFLDSENVGYLLGDASSAYAGIDKFYRHVIYNKDGYFIVLDELRDNAKHKYEFLLGTDHRHRILSRGEGEFVISPTSGRAGMPVVFVEPRALESSIAAERPYGIVISEVDLLRVWPRNRSSASTFFSLHYPVGVSEQPPRFEKIYDGSRSGIAVNESDFYLYNQSRARFSFNNIETDATLCYFREDTQEPEYLAVAATTFSYGPGVGFDASNPIVAAFSGKAGTVRLAKKFGSGRETEITIKYPGISSVRVDGREVILTGRRQGAVTFRLQPKTLRIGPSNARQTVTDNYTIAIVTDPALLQPQLALSMNEFDFGRVVMSSSAGKSLEITNAGGDTLQIKKLSFVEDAAGEFGLEVPAAGFVLPPGQSQSLGIIFSPAAAGVRRAALRIESNDPDRSLVEIPLLAEGVTAPQPGSISFEEVVAGGSSKSLRVSTTGPVTGAEGRLYLAAVTSRQRVRVEDVTGLGVSWTPLVSQCSGRNRTGIEIWYAVAGLPQSGAVTARLASSPMNAAIAVAGYSGVDPAQPFAEVMTRNSNGTPGTCSGGIDANNYSLTANSVADGALLFGAVAMRNKVHLPGAGVTERIEFTQKVGRGSAGLALLEKDPAAIGDASLFGSFDAPVDWAAALVQLQPLPPAPGAVLTVRPDSLDFGRVVKDSTSGRDLVVRNAGSEDLLISEISKSGTGSDAFQVLQQATGLAIQPGMEENVNLVFAPSATGRKEALLTLVSNDKDSPLTVVLQGEGIALPAGRVVVSPAVHDFGETVIGASDSVEFSIRNAGLTEVAVLTTGIGGVDSAAFSVDRLTGFQLAPGSERFLKVRFDAVSAGEKAAFLHISNDNGESPRIEILLSANVLPDLPDDVAIVRFEESAVGGSSNQLRLTTATALTGVSGHLYLAAITSKPNVTVREVSGLGLTWTQVESQCSGRNRTGVKVWWAAGAEAGNGSVSAILASSPRNAGMIVARYSGADVTDPVANLMAANSNGQFGSCRKGVDSDNYSLESTGKSPGSLVFTAVAMRSRSLTPDSADDMRGFFVQKAGLGAAGLAILDRQAEAGNNIELTGTFNAPVDWAACAFEIRPKTVTLAGKAVETDAGPLRATLNHSPGSPFIPEQFFLSQNYPNPFNGKTTIEYGLSAAATVRFSIYNIQGQLVWRWGPAQKQAGIRRVVWQGRNNDGLEVSSGIYLLILEAGPNKLIRRITLQR